MESTAIQTIAQLFEQTAAAVPGLFSVISAIIAGLSAGGILTLFALIFPVMRRARGWFSSFMGGRSRRRR